MGSGQQVFRRGGLKRKEETDWCEEIEKKLKRLNEIEHLSAGKKECSPAQTQWYCFRCS